MLFIFKMRDADIFSSPVAKALHDLKRIKSLFLLWDPKVAHCCELQKQKPSWLRQFPQRLWGCLAVFQCFELLWLVLQTLNYQGINALWKYRLDEEWESWNASWWCLDRWWSDCQASPSLVYRHLKCIHGRVIGERLTSPPHSSANFQWV